MRHHGYIVSPKSVMEPTTFGCWLGEDMHLDDFGMPLASCMIAHFICLYHIFVLVKDLQWVVGLLG